MEAGYAVIPTLDELMAYEVEPCETCEVGIAKMVCHDGLRRCQSCVLTHATAMGWDAVHRRDATVGSSPRLRT